MKFSLSKLLIFLLLTVAVSTQTNAQNAGIKGILIDTTDANPYISGAKITLRQNGKKQVSNDSGRFEFKRLKPGKYSIDINSSIYKTVTIVDIIVKSDSVVNLVNIYLELNVTEMKPGKIRIKGPPKNTMGVATNDEKKAKGVVNVLPAEAIKNGTDNNAAAAAARIPGVTLMEGRFL
ncbi:MAG: carboxypeptidase regulatory-like domain-containing protein, partial [Bacteroidia bacterium]|nr:carboxypeptidase regulatory-like domain-containing protein [Bacteroidia bacterium]